MIALTLAAVAAAAMVVAFVVRQRDLPVSLSEAFCQFGSKWYSALMAFETLAMGYALLWNTSEMWMFMAVFVVCGIIGLGVAPHCRIGLDSEVYGASLAVTAVSSQLWLVFEITPMFAFAWALAPMFIMCSSKLFWCEVLCMGTLAVGLGMRILNVM